MSPAIDLTQLPEVRVSIKIEEEDQYLCTSPAPISSTATEKDNVNKVVGEGGNNVEETNKLAKHFHKMVGP